MIKLESLESPFVVPLMMTCPNDNIQLVSTSIPNSIQENESFIINLEKLSNWKGVSADDNGAWTLKGSRCRSYSVKMMEMVELLLSTKLVKSIPTLLFAGH